VLSIVGPQDILVVFLVYFLIHWVVHENSITAHFCYGLGESYPILARRCESLVVISSPKEVEEG
jgi:hypothetical protein